MKKLILGLFLGFVLFCGSAFGGYEYKAKVDHEGVNVTPAEAYEMVLKDVKHTFIVDTRTRAEYQFIGHPLNAYNIPLKFWTGKIGEKEYNLEDNKDFIKMLLAKFNPKTDTLIFMCRSGKRSCLACKAAIKAGWDAKHAYNILGGFEGDKVKNKNSIYHGQRKLGGWQNEGLPWSYHIDKKFIYTADLK